MWNDPTAVWLLIAVNLFGLVGVCWPLIIMYHCMRADILVCVCVGKPAC